jgi:tRNA A-37 threonylcarbamoyl transferase component Bud32
MGSRVPAEPGRLLASGRACDVFECGPGAVLRRYREAGDPVGEAAVMRAAAEAGVPVPRVLEVRPDALVLERVDGPTMLEDIGRRPWRFLDHAKELGRIHRRIVDTPAPAGLERRWGDGDRLLHMDMHPLNVILGVRGPVVIDWPNACAGDPAADVAYSQVVLATSDSDFPRWLERVGRAVRRRFVAAYLDGVGIAPTAEQLAIAADHRMNDRHLREGELAAVRRLRAAL